jgi:deoxycytidylate deaminase
MNEELNKIESLDNKKFRSKEYQILHTAINVAKKSNMRAKHGCVIVKQGKIISVGYNRSLGNNKYQTRNFNNDKTVSQGKYSIHAEQDALRNTDPKNLEGAKLYVIRIGCGELNPMFMNSQPCKRCTNIINKYIEKHGLKQVYYSTDNFFNEDFEINFQI